MKPDTTPELLRGEALVFGMLVFAALSSACSGPRMSEEEVIGQDTAGAFVAGYQAFEEHTGPPVTIGSTGPFLFVEQLLEHFDEERALADAAHADRWFREPANDGYEAVMDRLEAELRAAGYGAMGFELEEIVTPRSRPAWTPLSGSLELVRRGDVRETLLSFRATPPDSSSEPEEDEARTMLPTGCRSAELTGPAALELAQLSEGGVLLTAEPLGRRLCREAEARGAACVLSSHLPELNVDPTGRERHLDAIHYGSAPRGVDVAVGHISPRLHERLRSELERDPGLQLAFRSEVRLDDRPLRTLVATLEGARRPEEAVVIAAHVQEPGAVDNASGVAGLLEAARVLREQAARGELEPPERTLCLVWGDEYTMSQVFLDHTELDVVAAFSSDMTGPSPERTGAIALFEREPDPGALSVLPPDEHSAWGAGEVPWELNPSGLSIIARCAMIDVALVEGSWVSADHPWEGGSDHDVFLGRGIPAGLFWHFTDFAYHTSLDRMAHVDGAELRRTTAALVGSGLAIADARPEDLERYLRSLRLDRRVRLEAAREAGDDEALEAWTGWFEGARHWLRTLCMGLEPSNVAIPEVGR